MESTKQDSSRHWQFIDWKGSMKTGSVVGSIHGPLSLNEGAPQRLWGRCPLNLCPSPPAYSCLPGSCTWYGYISCVAVLMPNNVFDCEGEGASTVISGKSPFATGLVRKMEYCQRFPSLLLFTAYFQQLCNCFPFRKRNIVPLFGFSFNCVARPKL